MNPASYDNDGDDDSEERSSKTKSFWMGGDISTDVARRQIKELMGPPVFDFPKSIDLIKRTLYMGIKNVSSDIVLDFFSGSATTAHAVMQLNAEDGGNRKFIMVQIPEPTAEDSEAKKAGYRTITEIGKERIRRAGDKIMAEWREKQSGLLAFDEPPTPPDIGFRVFRLDSSNLQKWDDAYVPPDQLDLFYERMEQRLNRFKHDRRAIDVVYEVFLKYGIPLTEKLSTLEVQGRKFYAVGEKGYMFICLDEGLTVETIEEAAQHAPRTMIFADKAFVDDNEIINAGLVLEKAKIEFRWV
jgi:adenine-specific DNA-methyltransferase